MANALYTPYLESLLGTDVHSRVDFDTDTIKISLVDTADYTFSAAHADHDDLVALPAAEVSTATLASITTTSGTLDSGNPTFSAVTGDASEAIVMWKDSTVSSTSPLVLYMDTFSSGMPVTPNGGDINVTVNASGWFSF